VLHVQEIWFSPWLVVAGLVLGIGSSVVAATLAAVDAASTSPVQARQRSLIEERTQRVLPFVAAVGLVLMLAGIALAMLPSQSLVVGFMALMFIILGYGLVIPWAIHAITHVLKNALDKLGVVVSLAVGGISRNISRTGLAIAALSIAVSATFGVDVMIGSFRSTVDQWLKTLPGNSRALAESTPGVRSVSTGRTIDTRTSVGQIDMLVVSPHAHTDEGFEIIEQATSTPWDQWQEPSSLMISEPLATKHALQAGDSLDVFTEFDGFKSFTIAAVFRDYGSSHGKLLMERSVFDEHWNEPAYGSLGIILDTPETQEQLVDELRARLSTAQQPLVVQSNVAIHAQSLAVFDRTFEVTRVLRWLTVGVAFVGIFSALLALHLERAREFAILRASGATRSRIMQVVLTQTVIMGLMAGALALPLGWMMSELLIKVINGLDRCTIARRLGSLDYLAHGLLMLSR